MKNVIYLLTVIISLAFMNTGCTKPAEDTPDVKKTFSQQYPDWKSLTWVSTNTFSLANTYPKLNISINDNYNEGGITVAVFVVNEIKSIGTYNYFYKKVTLTSTSIIFSEPTIGNATREYTIISSFNANKEITLKYLGDTYVLSK
jgi:hypothetical protein